MALTPTSRGLTSPAFYLATTDTVITGSDVYLAFIAFCNTHSAELTVTLTDGQGIPYFSAKPISAGETLERFFPLPGFFFKDGIKVKASLADKITCWVQVERNG